MSATRTPLFRLLGIPIYLDLSWLLIMLLLTMTLANLFAALLQTYFPDAAAGLAPAAYWLMGLVAALLFFGCILLHELGHAVVARAHGIPIRGITLFLFGGVAELEEEPRSPRAELLMAVAGPAVSVVLAVAFGLLAWVAFVAGWPPPLLLVLGYLGLVNAVVLIFNMVPAFPLDGGRVLRAILWGATGSLRRATWWATLSGQAFAGVLFVWGAFQFLGGNLLGGVWTVLIGFFLRDAARLGYQQVLIRQLLADQRVRRFMTPDPVVVDPELDLRSWVVDFVYQYRHPGFPVVSGGRLEGYIDTDVLAELPQEEWSRRPVREAMRQDVAAISISPEASALAALEQMQRTGSGRLLVVEGGRLVGILSRRDLLDFLSLKLELEGQGRELPPPAPRKVEPLVRS